ncbi:MAG TPA: ABC transporter permease [Spirochaetia bacterium]|nr:ABC transporter permease [Spirochaetia bacterium]
MNVLGVLGRVRWLFSLVSLIVILVITGIINPNFLSYSNIINCFNSSVVYTLLAVGIAFVIMTGEIDVSIGSTMGLAAAIAGTLAKQNASWVTMALYAILLGLTVGIFNGIGVAVLGIPSLIFTLGVNGIVRGLVYIYSNGRTVENFAGEFTDFGSQILFADITVYYAVIIGIVIITHLLLTRTRRGKYFITVGDNIGGATLIGIPVTKTKIAAYSICGIFAAISGVAFASKYGQVNIVAGTGYEMTAIAACVLGGISLSGGLGNVIGAAIGAVIMSAISRLLVFIGLSSDFDNTIKGIMLISIVVIDAVTQRRSIEMARRERLAARANTMKEGMQE